jgi:hypothetical protein
MLTTRCHSSFQYSVNMESTGDLTWDHRDEMLKAHLISNLIFENLQRRQLELSYTGTTQNRMLSNYLHFSVD